MSDPFSLLGVEPRFGLDLGALEKQHRELSRTLHPDRFVGAPARERQLALSRAIEVNEAFRALRDPVSRAVALLRVLGSAPDEGKEPPSSPSFLMDLLEAREALAEARAERDLGAVHRLVAEARGREEACLSALGRALDGVPRDLAAAVARLGELRYARRFLSDAEAIVDDLDPAGSF